MGIQGSSSTGISAASLTSSGWQGQAQASQLQQLQQQFLNPGDADHKKLKKAAQDFEGVFVQQLLESMDKTIDREDSLMGGGSAEDTWRGMMNEEVAKSMTHRNGGSGIGLAEVIYRQMAQNLKTDSAEAPAPELNTSITQAPKFNPLNPIP